VIEVLTAVARAGEQARPVEVESDFEPPEPMEWAL